MSENSNFALTMLDGPPSVVVNRVREPRPVRYGRRSGQAPDRAEEEALIGRAMAILEGRMRTKDEGLMGPEDTIRYLKLKLGTADYECFGMICLDSRHRAIEVIDLFRGTIDGASIHTREVVRECLAANAAGVIFYHNHPSGFAAPSQADIRITGTLKGALRVLDVKVLDHFIIGGLSHYSFAEHGTL